MRLYPYFSSLKTLSLAKKQFLTTKEGFFYRLFRRFAARKFKSVSIFYYKNTKVLVQRKLFITNSGTEDYEILKTVER